MGSIFDHAVVLFGGSSEERLVSVATAQNVARHVPEAQLWFWSKDDQVFEVTRDELAGHANAFVNEFRPQGTPKFKSLSASLDTLKGKTVIIGLHGTEGEDGTLQAQLEQKGIKFTGSDARASSLAFDKRETKKLAHQHGIAIISDLAVTGFHDHEVTELEAFFAKHGKIVLKPLANGSSVGLYIVSRKVELDEAISAIRQKGILAYMSEPFLVGREITVGVWQKSATEVIPLPCSEVRVTQGGQFDYQGKYLGKGVEELTPAPITPAQAKQCQDLALKLHQSIGCKGYSRTDMILTEKGPVLLEINTLPGLTKASFVPQQLDAIKVSIREFFEAQLRAL